MGYIITIFGLFVSTVLFSQTKSSFVGEWHFFDKDSNYYECTITPKFLYQYRDSSQPIRKSIKLTKSTLAISSNFKWIIISNNADYLLVDIDHYHLKLFHKPLNSDSVKSLFYFLNEEHNGKAASIFVHGASQRKKQLIDKGR